MMMKIKFTKDRKQDKGIMGGKIVGSRAPKLLGNKIIEGQISQDSKVPTINS